MKFALRDLFWLIFLAALLCAAFLQRQRLCRQINVLENKIDMQKKEHWKALVDQKMRHVYAVGEMRVKHEKELSDHQKRISQHWKDLMKEEREAEKAARELAQKLQEWRENGTITLPEIPLQLLPKQEQLHMPPVQPKDGAF